MILVSIFLIYGLEFHKFSFSKYVSAVQKARNRKKTSLNIPERMVKRKRTLGQIMVYKKLEKKLKIQQNEQLYKPGVN